jgi:hypothetical protein
LDRILSVTPLEDLQFKETLISEDELIITYLDTSGISALPAKEELLQFTTPGIGSENEIEDPTPFPLSIEEDCFDDDIGNSSKAPACNLKGLKFEPAGQDLEEFMASKENLLELFAIISRNWSTAVEEDDNYTDLSLFQNNLLLLARFFVLDSLLWSKSRIEYFAIGWSIWHWYAATYAINQDSKVASRTELAVQGCYSHNHNNRGE